MKQLRRGLEPNQRQRNKRLRANQVHSSHQYPTNNISNLPSLPRLLLHWQCLPRPYQDKRLNP
uniref:Uncharacterized protein n=1 Tax=Cryptococcus bacillisporus CA1280 TaxID=1296109 RepID=A0A0D0VHE8_CRYGA|nr:hypothetical protein I312_03752 [Cryptococcus bacillisporus CA1280]